MPRHTRYLLLILLAGAALRLLGLDNLSPPGLAHDEVANWLIVRGILSGNHAVYFTAAYGHEAGFHYLQAAYVALLGNHALALRLPAAHVGLLLVAVSYALGRRLFGRRTALLAAALLALLFYAVFYSRLGLRAISMPLLSGFAAYAWWCGWDAVDRRRALLWSAAAGVLAGLALYTYLAARALPLFFGAYFIYLALVHWPIFRRRLPDILLFSLLFLLTTLPLLLFLANTPGAETRVGEVRGPLDALLAGDLRPVLRNGLRILGMAGWRGDPLWRQNVPPTPVFEIVTAALFYVGLAGALWRWRDPRHAFVLLWLGAAALPSLVTIDAPSSIRIANSLLFLTLLPAQVIHRVWGLSTEKLRLSTVRRRTALAGALFLLLLVGNGVRTTRLIFGAWPANDEVAFVWQAALTAAARYLDEAAPLPTAVGGWTPDTMDPPTMAVTLRREDPALRHFQPPAALLVPAGETARIVYPAALPLDPDLAALLAAWGAEFTTGPQYVAVTLAAPDPAPALAVAADFGGELTLLGLDARPEGEGLVVISYWRVAAPAGGPRRIFLHLHDPEDGILAQADALDVNALRWQAGDLIVQRLVVEQGRSRATDLLLGVYDPLTGRRLFLQDGTDALRLSMPLAPHS